MTNFLLLLLVLLNAAGVGMVLAHYAHERKTGRIVAQVMKGADELNKKLLENATRPAVPTAILPAQQPVGATRVYAAMLNNGQQRRLFIAPAASAEDFVTVGLSVVGDTWRAEVIDFVDVFPPKEKIVQVPVAPTKREKAALKTQDFIHAVEYLRDSFAETPSEKRVLGSVITKLKEKYAN